MNDTFIIIGLGNPGREYRGTRHNVGFMVVDKLAENFHKRFSRLESKALVTKAEYAENKIILAKPQTFMNLSGKSIQGLVHFYKIPLDHLLVIHDDIDLPLGVVRIRPDGGSAGQKGMRSILETLGTDELPRIRIGIGRPPGKMQPPDYVLNDFSDDEKVIINDSISRAVDAVMDWIKHGLNSAMNKYNG